MAKITIVTITRDRELLLPRCIASIQKQTFQDYEHIIVDNSTNDLTQHLVESYHDPKIRYFRMSPGLPVTDYWNAGSDRAEGEFLTYLDDDDEYLPEKLQKQYDFITSLPEDVGMVYCWMDYFDQRTGKWLKGHHPAFRGNVAELVLEVPTVSGTPTLLFRKSAFQKWGRWRDNIVSDWEMTARFCQHCKVDFLPEVLVKVYEHHPFLRMTQMNQWRNRIHFHETFLENYKDFFDRNPRKRHYHFYNLCCFYFMTGEYGKSFRYWLRCLKYKVTLKYLLAPAISFVRKYILQRGKK